MFICLFITLVSPFDISGRMATEIEPINVPGIVIIGRAIPVIAPKVAIAISIDVPLLVKK